MIGVSSATPTSSASTPARISHSVAPPAPDSPQASGTAPPTVTTAPRIVIRVSGRSVAADSRSAAIGATRDARSAGTIAATA